MDKKRRQRLKDAAQSLSNVISVVEQVLDKEQDCMDNYPENLIGSERFDRLEEGADLLSDAIEKLEEAKSNIINAISM